MKESEIQAAICDYLALKRYFFWRQNTTPTFDWKTKQFRAMPKYAKKGVADIILIRDGEAWFLEVKRLKGKQSPEQIEFEREAKAAGARYAVVFSLDDVMALGL